MGVEREAGGTRRQWPRRRETWTKVRFYQCRHYARMFDSREGEPNPGLILGHLSTLSWPLLLKQGLRNARKRHWLAEKEASSYTQCDLETVWRKRNICHLGHVFSAPEGLPSPVTFSGGLHWSLSHLNPPLLKPTQWVLPEHSQLSARVHGGREARQGPQRARGCSFPCVSWPQATFQVRKHAYSSPTLHSFFPLHFSRAFLPVRGIFASSGRKPLLVTLTMLTCAALVFWGNVPSQDSSQSG